MDFLLLLRSAPSPRRWPRVLCRLFLALDSYSRILIRSKKERAFGHIIKLERIV
jgi:hypothetical protein